MKDKDIISRSEFNDLKEGVKELHKVFDTVNRLTVVTEKLALEIKYLREDQNNVEERLKVLEEKPIKKYDDLTKAIVTTVIGIILGAIAMLIGLK